MTPTPRQQAVAREAVARGRLLIFESDHPDPAQDDVAVAAERSWLTDAVADAADVRAELDLQDQYRADLA